MRQLQLVKSDLADIRAILEQQIEIVTDRLIVGQHELRCHIDATQQSCILLLPSDLVKTGRIRLIQRLETGVIRSVCTTNEVCLDELQEICVLLVGVDDELESD